MFGDGPIPPERDRRVEDDDKSFREVLLLFLRSWPYIRPQFLGRWLIPGEGVEQRVAETGSGYQLTYAPFLVAAIALVGPLLGVVPATMAWPMNLLYLPIVALVLSASWGGGGWGQTPSWRGVWRRGAPDDRHRRPRAVRARHEHLRDLLHRRLRGQLLRRRRHRRRHRRLDVPVPRRPGTAQGARPGGRAPRVLLRHQLRPALYRPDARRDPRRSAQPEHPAERTHRAGARGPVRHPGVGARGDRELNRRPAPRTRLAVRQAGPRRPPRATAAAHHQPVLPHVDHAADQPGPAPRAATTANTVPATPFSASTRTAPRSRR